MNGVPWSSENPRRNSHTFNCRMLVNPHSEPEDEQQEQEAQQKYETMQCFAVSEPKSIKEEGEGQTSNVFFSFLLSFLFFFPFLYYDCLEFCFSVCLFFFFFFYSALFSDLFSLFLLSCSSFFCLLLIHCLLPLSLYCANHWLCRNACGCQWPSLNSGVLSPQCMASEALPAHAAHSCSPFCVDALCRRHQPA